MWKEHEADNYAANNVSEHNLQEGEIALIRQPGNADDGQRAGLGRNNRERNRPPGNVAVGQKVVTQRALPLAKAQPEQSDPRQIDCDDRKIKTVQAHLIG